MQIPDFGSGLIDVAARTGIVYVFLVIALRLGGKHQVGQLSLFDFIVLLLVADAVQNAMVGENTTLAGGLVAATTLVVLDQLLDKFAGRSGRVRKVLEGEPRILIRNGVVLEKALREEGIRRDELDAALRSNGL
ncbi:MAG TPA: YetF domain-containing protein, partial [Candidatus Limnocylindrales bacterium]|nr:YetF domain-containing protein [Candidatus Limnocylindrales bacterium]